MCFLMFQRKNASFWKISLLLYTICIIFLMFFAFGRQSGTPDVALRYSFVITGIPLWMPRHFSLLWVFSMGNLLAFAPFGLLLPRAFPTRLHSYSRCLAVFAAAVIALELMQMLTRLGSFDMEDILVNTWGFSLGFYAVRLSRERPVALACWLVVLTVLSILAAELLNSVFFGR